MQGRRVPPVGKRALPHYASMVNSAPDRQTCVGPAKEHTADGGNEGMDLGNCVFGLECLKSRLESGLLGCLQDEVPRRLGWVTVGRRLRVPGSQTSALGPPGRGGAPVIGSKGKLSGGHNPLSNSRAENCPTRLLRQECLQGTSLKFETQALMWKRCASANMSFAIRIIHTHAHTNTHTRLALAC